MSPDFIGSHLSLSKLQFLLQFRLCGPAFPFPAAFFWLLSSWLILTLSFNLPCSCTIFFHPALGEKSIRGVPDTQLWIFCLLYRVLLLCQEVCLLPNLFERVSKQMCSWTDIQQIWMMLIDYYTEVILSSATDFFGTKLCFSAEVSSG